MDKIELPRLYTMLPEKPVQRENISFLGLIFRALGLVRSVVYAWLLNGPGIRLHFGIILQGISLILKGGSTKIASELIFFPMDSVRYFELSYFWERLCSKREVLSYLDVSSPRILSMRVLQKNLSKKVVILNPDKEDIEKTENLIREIGAVENCEFRSEKILELDVRDRVFDVIACISVIEHIPIEEARASLTKMWGMLAPGGSLYISVPCAKSAFEEYISFNEYGILDSDPSGYVFGQRFYDSELLRTQIYDVIGHPLDIKIFGEKKEGVFFSNRNYKLSCGEYPFWNESSHVASNYMEFASIEGLPGVGVVTLEFVKK